jgi:hypothetical protein
MNISKETKNYFQQLIERTADYTDVKYETLQYLVENDIQNETLKTACYVGALIWKATNRGDWISEQEVFALLGTDWEGGAECVPKSETLEIDNLYDFLDTIVEDYTNLE